MFLPRPVLRILLSCTALSALCLGASYPSDCPPNSSDFDNDGVIDVFQVSNQSGSGSLLSGADSHLLFTVSTGQGEERFSGAFGSLNRGAAGTTPDLIAGILAGGDHPSGGVISILPATGQVRWTAS